MNNISKDLKNNNKTPIIYSLLIGSNKQQLRDLRLNNAFDVLMHIFDEFINVFDVLRCKSQFVHELIGPLQLFCFFRKG